MTLNYYLIHIYRVISRSLLFSHAATENKSQADKK